MLRFHSLRVSAMKTALFLKFPLGKQPCCGKHKILVLNLSPPSPLKTIVLYSYLMTQGFLTKLPCHSKATWLPTVWGSGLPPSWLRVLPCAQAEGASALPAVSPRPVAFLCQPGHVSRSFREAAPVFPELARSPGDICSHLPGSFGIHVGAPSTWASRLPQRVYVPGARHFVGLLGPLSGL